MRNKKIKLFEEYTYRELDSRNLRSLAARTSGYLRKKLDGEELYRAEDLMYEYLRDASEEEAGWFRSGIKDKLDAMPDSADVQSYISAEAKRLAEIFFNFSPAGYIGHPDLEESLRSVLNESGSAESGKEEFSFIIRFLNQNKNYAEDSVIFTGETREEAMQKAFKWGSENLDNFKPDMIEEI